MNIEYTKNMNIITPDMLPNFFAGWPNPPSPDVHLQILQNSYRAFVAIDNDCNRVVGFINAVSDGILSAYIPLLEVTKAYQGRGIGSNLVKLMLSECKHLYMIDICHDEDLVPYYARFGAFKSQASVFRNYSAQSGGAIE